VSPTGERFVACAIWQRDEPWYLLIIEISTPLQSCAPYPYQISKTASCLIQTETLLVADLY
jgi:hypothetical protein